MEKNNLTEEQFVEELFKGKYEKLLNEFKHSIELMMKNVTSEYIFQMVTKREDFIEMMLYILFKDEEVKHSFKARHARQTFFEENKEEIIKWIMEESMEETLETMFKSKYEDLTKRSTECIIKFCEKNIPSISGLREYKRLEDENKELKEKIQSLKDSIKKI